VHIGSIASVHASGGLGYNATKFAMSGLTKAAARDLGPENIRANTVLPSWMIGPSTAGINQARAAAALPLRRMGDTAKIAKLVTFLASDDAEFITGADYLVDGGALLMGTFDVMGLLAGQGLGALPASALQP
jgi:3alpha(or 20beta)-hydroxysteroid dehydrogenase